MKMMHVYGAYGVPLETPYDPTAAALAAEGWTVAYCHTRGGGERGSAWYRAGSGTNKPNAISGTRCFAFCGVWQRLSFRSDPRPTPSPTPPPKIKTKSIWRRLSCCCRVRQGAAVGGSWAGGGVGGVCGWLHLGGSGKRRPNRRSVEIFICCGFTRCRCLFCWLAMACV